MLPKSRNVIIVPAELRPKLASERARSVLCTLNQLGKKGIRKLEVMGYLRLMGIVVSQRWINRSCPGYALEEVVR